MHEPLNEGSYVSSAHNGPGNETRSPLIFELVCEYWRLFQVSHCKQTPSAMTAASRSSAGL